MHGGNLKLEQFQFIAYFLFGVEILRRLHENQSL